jgi:hypothetical protein
MKMKYESDLCNISDCPPSNCVQKDIDAYRFVYNPICPKSFIPQGKKSPQRVSKSSNDTERCSLLGLSMFESEGKALEKYKYLKKTIKNIDKTIGSHLAKGKIKPKHGLLTKPNNQGHYDLFEFKGTNLSPDFQILLDLSGV